MLAFCLRATPICALRLLLALHLIITSGVLRGAGVVPRIEPVLAVDKASILPTILSLQHK